MPFHPAALEVAQSVVWKKTVSQIVHFRIAIKKYSITLGEMVGENPFSPVPWRDQDVKPFGEAINKMLNDPDDQVWRSDESRRSFEPFRLRRHAVVRRLLPKACAPFDAALEGMMQEVYVSRRNRAAKDCRE